jgi:hypothetical protein
LQSVGLAARRGNLSGQTGCARVTVELGHGAGVDTLFVPSRGRRLRAGPGAPALSHFYDRRSASRDGQRAELALLTRRKDLLVAGLDLLESDGLALPHREPLGDRLGTLLVAASHVESPAGRKRQLGERVAEA